MLSESDAVDDKTLEDHVRGLQRKQVQVSPASHLPPLKKAESPSSSSYGIWVLIGASGDGPQAGSAEGGEERGAGPGDGSAALRLGDLCCTWPARAVGIPSALP